MATLTAMAIFDFEIGRSFLASDGVESKVVATLITILQIAVAGMFGLFVLLESD